MTADKSASPTDDVPKLPRGRGFKLQGPELFRIVMFTMMLVAVVVLAKPCANAVSSFVMSMGSGSAGSGSAGSASGAQGSAGTGGSAAAPKVEYEVLRPGMSDEELKAAIERAKARAHGSAAGSGSP